MEEQPPGGAVVTDAAATAGKEGDLYATLLTQREGRRTGGVRRSGEEVSQGWPAADVGDHLEKPKPGRASLRVELGAEVPGMGVTVLPNKHF